ncbi:MAG: ribonuclease PH [Deltaproteobacteria bacterium]|nr:MAG: ribonuclease PH [Deltaproteobacteria bacterium]
MRIDGRDADQMREISVEKNPLKYAEGSALIKVGNTHVLCAASVEEGVPPFLKNSGGGWITAEYGMLPRATFSRNAREAAKGKQGGRTLEIQRLIGRSLRSVTDMSLLGEQTIRIDCDVLQADGGTRVASITGGYIALMEALKTLVGRNRLSTAAIAEPVAAVSVGLLGGKALLDLCYEEDSKALVDLNVVMTASGGIVEIQGTGEDRPFSRADMDKMLDLAEAGIKSLIALQQEALGL